MYTDPLVKTQIAEDLVSYSRTGLDLGFLLKLH